MSDLDLIDRWIESLQILAGDADNPTAEQHAAMAATRRKMLDIYAHGLAETIRAEADRARKPDESAMGRNLRRTRYRSAADLIDPQKSAGPVRPGEETTP